MKALSIRQPWAQLIATGRKDIENRKWSTKFRGEFLIHTGKVMTRDDWDDACDVCQHIGKSEHPIFKDQLNKGGFVGIAEIVDCVTEIDSPWFFGAYGFVIKNARPIDFIPYRGQLGFFNVEEKEIYDATRR